MKSSARPAIDGACARRVPCTSSVRCGLALTTLLICGGLAARSMAAVRAEDQDAPAPTSLQAPRQLPAAVWQLPGQVFVVELTLDPSVAARSFTAAAHLGLVDKAYGAADGARLGLVEYWRVTGR